MYATPYPLNKESDNVILEEFIKENYGKVKAKEIAKLYNVPLYKVYGLAKKLKIKINL